MRSVKCTEIIVVVVIIAYNVDFKNVCYRNK